MKTSLLEDLIMVLVLKAVYFVGTMLVFVSGAALFLGQFSPSSRNAEAFLDHPGAIPASLLFTQGFWIFAAIVGFAGSVFGPHIHQRITQRGRGRMLEIKAASELAGSKLETHVREAKPK